MDYETAEIGLEEIQYLNQINEHLKNRNIGEATELIAKIRENYEFNVVMEKKATIRIKLSPQLNYPQMVNPPPLANTFARINMMPGLQTPINQASLNMWQGAQNLITQNPINTRQNLAEAPLNMGLVGQNFINPQGNFGNMPSIQIPLSPNLVNRPIGTMQKIPLGQNPVNRPTSTMQKIPLNK